MHGLNVTGFVGKVVCLPSHRTRGVVTDGASGCDDDGRGDNGVDSGWSEDDGYLLAAVADALRILFVLVQILNCESKRE